MLMTFVTEGNDDAYQSRPLGPQAACHLIGSEIVLAGNSFDLFAGADTDQVTSRQRPRHRSWRHARDSREIGDVSDTLGASLFFWIIMQHSQKNRSSLENDKLAILLCRLCAVYPLF